VDNQVKLYVGFTNDLDRRLNEHNSQDNTSYTARYKPWQLVCYFAFADETRAIGFEKFLKSGVGKIFLKKRII
jgi:predicted GIY-YIG superfamily endonuclease